MMYIPEYSEYANGRCVGNLGMMIKVNSDYVIPRELYEKLMAEYEAKFKGLTANSFSAIVKQDMVCPDTYP